MRLSWLATLMAVGVGIALAADPAETPQKGLFVHEWGVINVYNDVELANADRRSAWEGLPKFVYGNVDQRRIPREELLEVTVPVIYFHTPQEIAVQVKLEFPGGRPAVWWPANSNIHRSTRRGETKATCDKHLEWRLALNTSNATPRLQPLLQGHWMAACRAVHAAEVLTTGNLGRAEREKFVYY